MDDRIINFEGRQIHVPIDATDDEVAGIINEAAPDTTPRFVRDAMKPGIFENIVGSVSEPVIKFASSMAAKPVGELAGLATLAGRGFGMTDADPTAVKQSVQSAITMQPSTTAGASEWNPLNKVPELLGRGIHAVTAPAMSALRGDSAADSARGMAVNFLGEAVPQGLGLLGVKKVPALAKVGEKPAISPGPLRVAARQEAAAAASNADWQRAAMIDAAKVGRANDIILPPALVNEGKYGVRTAMAGGNDHFNVAASIANKEKWNNMARRQLGIGENAQLTAATYDRVRAGLAKPYDEAATLGILQPDAGVVKAIRDLDVPDILPAGEKTASNLQKISDHVIGKIEGGMTGADAVNTTKALRANAKSVFDSVRAGNVVDHATVQSAKAQMAMAEKIDELISNNIKDPKWKDRFDSSRSKMAQSYALERATNLAKRQIDPAVFAEEMMGRHQLTGAAKEMGEIAANYPEIANVYAKRGAVSSMPVRSGVTGTTGFAIGSLYGAPVSTSALTATIGSLGEKVYGKRLMGAKLQEKYATPIDRRLYEAEPPRKAQGLLGMDGYVAPTSFRETADVWSSGKQQPPNFTFPSGSSIPENMRPMPTDYFQPLLSKPDRPVSMQPTLSKLTPEDVINRTRFPNDAAKAEYVRASDLLRVAQEKEAALQAMSARNLNPAQRLQLRQSMETQREAVMLADAKLRYMDEMYMAIQDEVSKGRPAQRSGVRGAKTMAHIRGLMQGDK